MADLNTTPEAGETTYFTDPNATSTPAGNSLTVLTNAAGALVSLALVVGIGVWGYDLLKRDVSGIPVVRAASGEMRVRPEDPGGQLAQHQGLSVNAVAAEGAAAAPADELRLAPQPVDLTEEDRIMPAAMVADPPQSETPRETPDIAAALQSGDVDALVAQLTEGVEPLAEVVAEAEPEEVIATVAEAVAQEVVAAQPVTVAAVLDAPGVRQSLRPRKRPAARAQVTPASLTTEDTQEVDAASLPTGTRLAQLGAFDSAEVAREQWDMISARFSAYMHGKQRVVQKASSGGRTFYRLRAMGFEDIADARRFCSALVAENADCIPVVTR